MFHFKRRLRIYPVLISITLTFFKIFMSFYFSRLFKSVAIVTIIVFLSSISFSHWRHLYAWLRYIVCSSINPNPLHDTKILHFYSISVFCSLHVHSIILFSSFARISFHRRFWFRSGLLWCRIHIKREALKTSTIILGLH